MLDSVLGDLTGADWAALSDAGRETLFVSIATRTALTTEQLTALGAVFEGASNKVITATREALIRDQGLTLNATFNVVDERIQAHVKTTQTLFVHSEYGARLKGFEGRVRQLVAAGLAKGLGQIDIGNAIASVADTMLIKQSPWYWTLSSAAVTARARSLGQVSGYSEAGITTYQIQAVLDKRTTNICRFLHGQTFTVADGLSRFEATEQLAATDPDGFVDAFKSAEPWVREQTNAAGERIMVANTPGGTVQVAVIERSGVGNRDDVGAFKGGLTGQQLASSGLGFPPYHGVCRTTTLAG